jgi:hypothetical protein
MIPGIDKGTDLAPLPIHSRCTEEGCRRKGLTDTMICRCQRIICALHMGNHGCTFDYAAVKEQIRGSRAFVEWFNHRTGDEA